MNRVPVPLERRQGGVTCYVRAETRSQRDGIVSHGLHAIVSGRCAWNARDLAPRQAGLTLIELLVGVVILASSVTALLGAFLSQMTLNEHARNLTWAVNDADRVIEELRLRNTDPCVGAPDPTVAAPAPFASWDAWLADTATGGGGKSFPANQNEVLAVLPVAGAVNPIGVTVAACWTHRGRAIGDCDTGDGAISSPAMLSTSVTCRQ